MRQPSSHPDVLHTRTQHLAEEVAYLLGATSNLSREERQDVLDHIIEHAGWCERVIEEHGGP